MDKEESDCSGGEESALLYTLDMLFAAP